MPSTKQEAIGFLDPAIKEELFMRFWDSVGRRVRSFQSRGTARAGFTALQLQLGK
jgi:hypothetical protein